MRDRLTPTPLQHLLEAATKRWLRPLQRTAHAPASTFDNEAASSTLFMHSVVSPEPRGEVFKVRIARRPSVLQDALSLVNRRYRQRGYGSQALTMSPERMTIVVYEGNQVSGTLTVQLDSSHGLLSDECFPQELDGLRARGASLCEFTKLATAPQAPMPSTLASMFHVAFIFAHQLNHATHAVVEVNPRHVAFYTRVLGFTSCGAPKSNPRVKAPGVLLVAEFKHIEQQLRARATRGGDASEPPAFFTHGFTDAEAKGIRNRMRSTLRRLGEAEARR